MMIVIEFPYHEDRDEVKTVWSVECNVIKLRAANQKSQVFAPRQSRSSRPRLRRSNATEVPAKR